MPSEIQGTRKFSSIPVINTYAFNTPGLILLSNHQDMTLTGTIVEFLQFPLLGNNGYSAAGQENG